MCFTNRGQEGEGLTSLPLPWFVYPVSLCSMVRVQGLIHFFSFAVCSTGALSEPLGVTPWCGHLPVSVCVLVRQGEGVACFQPR